MFSDPALMQGLSCLALTGSVIDALRTVNTREVLVALMAVGGVGLRVRPLTTSPSMSKFSRDFTLPFVFLGHYT
ncbi:hypothetical protein BV95_02004 [Sphingobium chlorophenolicum]|uniref:Uncharacterized protein n=1 Tax=Sphingobium chlorophenolicum TaxID=46429 RepID=A0A081RF15_SPHCR|nr:hypothetical protein BV95_02004 [Sphingobium chlorophenolicum]